MTIAMSKILAVNCKVLIDEISDATKWKRQGRINIRQARKNGHDEVAVCKGQK